MRLPNIRAPRLRVGHEDLVYAGYAGGWALARALPEPAAYRLFTLLADLAWARRGPAVARLEANLRRVLGPGAGDRRVREVSRAGMRSYLRYWCELFRLPDWDRERTVAPVTVLGEHHMREALAARRGWIAALPHMGNWDHAGAWACRTGAPVVTVAERVRPERLFERFVAARGALGMTVLPLTGAGQVLGELAAALADNRVVCLLADRDLGGAGVEVRFFGAPARMPAGPALLALRSSAPLHPVTVAYDGPGITVTMHDPVPVPPSGTTRERAAAMTQGVAAVFERAIADAPHDWHMLQPVWPVWPAGPARSTAGEP